jgi:hypothetical protein
MEDGDERSSHHIFGMFVIRHWLEATSLGLAKKESGTAMIVGISRIRYSKCRCKSKSFWEGVTFVSFIPSIAAFKTAHRRSTFCLDIVALCRGQHIQQSDSFASFLFPFDQKGIGVVVVA